MEGSRASFGHVCFVCEIVLQQRLPVTGGHYNGMVSTGQFNEKLQVRKMMAFWHPVDAGSANEYFFRFRIIFCEGGVVNEKKRVWM